MEIRKANKKDFGKLLELIIQNTKYNIKLDKMTLKPQKLNWESLEEIKKTESEELKKDFRNSKKKIFVAVLEEKIIGFIKISFLGKNPYIKTKRGEIDELFVLEDYRKKGIGKALIKKGFFLFKSKEIKLISISVISNNIPTLKIYEKLGFKESVKRMNLKLK